MVRNPHENTGKRAPMTLAEVFAGKHQASPEITSHFIPNLTSFEFQFEKLVNEIRLECPTNTYNFFFDISKKYMQYSTAQKTQAESNTTSSILNMEVVMIFLCVYFKYLILRK